MDYRHLERRDRHVQLVRCLVLHSRWKRGAAVSACSFPEVSDKQHCFTRSTEKLLAHGLIASIALSTTADGWVDAQLVLLSSRLSCFLPLSPPNRHSRVFPTTQLTGTLPPQWSAMTGLQQM